MTKQLLNLHGAVAALLIACLPLAGFSAEAPRKSFDVPAGEAAAALKQFTTQSGVQLLYSTSELAGVKTQPVRGSLTVQEALDAMLADTGLVASQDTKTGAFAVRKGESDPNVERAIKTISDRPLEMQRVEVTDTRIDGLNNKGLLQGGLDSPLYHEVMTRAEIERSGVTSIEELLRYIPLTSSPRTFFQTNDITANISGGLSTRFSTTSLRGFDSTQTVILINGRVLPRSSSGGGADLNRIPLAAIERVEILPYAGSAIYGSGAIGGAINVILRKGYSGQELTVYFGTSTDGGAGEYRFSLLDGRTFHNGRGRVTTTISYQHRDPLRANQRGYLARAIARYTPDYRKTLDGTGRTPYENFILPSIIGAPATIVTSNAPTAAVNDLGIPGAPGARWAMVPSGTTVANSLMLTPASFTTTAGQAAPAGQSPRAGRTVLYEPIDTYSLNSQVEYDILPEEKLSTYGEFTYGYTRKQYSFPQSAQVSLTATDPLNPFRTSVTPGFVGRPVVVRFQPVDIAEPNTIWEYESARAVVGLKGRLSDRVEWSADGAIDYTHNIVDSDNPPQNAITLNALTLSTAGAAPAAARRAVYPLLADHTQFPIDSTDFFNQRFYASHTQQKEGNLRFNADLINLPAGTVRASVFSKYNTWRNVGSQSFHATPSFEQLVYGGPNPRSIDPTSEYLRNVWQNAVETVLPVISEKWRPIPLIQSLDLQASVSTERTETWQPGTVINKQKGDSHALAAKLQFTRDVALRFSRSVAFAPPEWFQVINPPSSFIFPFGALPDPARGNSIQGPGFNVLSGGNPNVQPEQAKSKNAGLILTPRFASGLSLHLDYWQIEKYDAILTVGWPTAIANPALYGFLITRSDPTPEEKARGWAGIITEFDSRPINASRTKTEGVDVRGRYLLETQTLGSFELNANATFTNNFLLVVTSTSVPQNTSGGSGPVRWRGNGSVTWNMRPWTMTLGARYVGHFSTNSTNPSPSYPGAIAYDGGRIPAYMHYDLQVSYEVRAGNGRRGWRSWVAGTKWTVGANNVLNTKPSFMTGFTGIGDSRSFYNVYDDPRQRFVYLSINKQL